MSQYLEEAAALLRKAADETEKLYLSTQGYSPAAAQRQLIEGRERIAMKFAQLGAIDAGLIPTEMIQDLLAAAARGESR